MNRLLLLLVIFSNLFSGCGSLLNSKSNNRSKKKYESYRLVKTMTEKKEEINKSLHLTWINNDNNSKLLIETASICSQRKIDTKVKTTRYRKKYNPLSLSLFALAEFGAAYFTFKAAPGFSNKPNITKEGEKTLSDRGIMYTLGTSFALSGIADSYFLSNMIYINNFENYEEQVTESYPWKSKLCKRIPLISSEVIISLNEVSIGKLTSDNGEAAEIIEHFLTNISGRMNKYIATINSLSWEIAKKDQVHKSNRLKVLGQDLSNKHLISFLTLPKALKVKFKSIYSEVDLSISQIGLLSTLQSKIKARVPEALYAATIKASKSHHFIEAKALAELCLDYNSDHEDCLVAKEMSICKLTVAEPYNGFDIRISDVDQLIEEFSTAEAKKCLEKHKESVETTKKRELAKQERERRKEAAREAREERKIINSWSGRISRAESMCYKINAYRRSRNFRALQRIQERAQEVIGDASEAISEMQYRDVSENRIYRYMRRIQRACRGY